MPKPSVILPPKSSSSLKQGFDTLADLLAITLGPTKGCILIESEIKGAPELLTDAATIARRVVALPDRSQDVGAMLLRQLVWQVRQRVGDGSTLTAVLAQAILHEANRYVTAGANPVLVQKGIKRGVQAAVRQLHTIAQPAETEDALTAVAHAVTGEPKLSLILGEMMDLLGPQAHITIEDYVAPYLDRVYLDGGRWQGKLASPYLINTPTRQRAILKNCQIALYDGRLQSLDEIQTLLDIVAQQKSPHLLLVAHEISSDVLSTLVAIHTSDKNKLQLIVVNLTLGGIKANAALTDLALLTGAELVSPQLGRTMRSITADSLGQAKRVEADASQFIVIQGRGKAQVVREQVETLERRRQALPVGDAAAAELEQRIGRLSGSAAILKIGALTKAERTVLHTKADQGVKALKATLEEGIVPGGGMAYVHCIPAVTELKADIDDEQMGLQAVANALNTPFLRILTNAGIRAPAVVLDNVLRQGPDSIYDVMQGRIRPALTAGVVDPAKALRVALETAASGALMAISVDVVVLKRKPQLSYEP